MTAPRDDDNETLERFFTRRQQYYEQIDSLRAEALALWEKFRSDRTLSMTEVARLEGIRRQRQSIFESYQADEGSFIDLVLKHRRL